MRISLTHPRLIYLPSQQPLGLGYIAACLEGAGHQVQIIEAVFYPTDEDVVAAVRAFGAKQVGISAMVNYHRKALTLVRLLKEADPELCLGLGGRHASTVPEAFTPCPEQLSMNSARKTIGSALSIGTSTAWTTRDCP